MEAKYFPIQIEEKWSKVWADRELAKPESENFFSQIIPPPNVTGTLHMGHSFQYAIMDFYTRYHHMNGTDAYWQVGTCLLYTSPSPRDKRQSRMPSSA